MSLINEALKRTQAAQQPPPVRQPDPVRVAEAMLPPRPTPAGKTAAGQTRRARMIFSGALCVVALGALAFVTWQFSCVRSRQKLDYMPATHTPPPPGVEGLPPHIRDAIKGATTAPAAVDAKAIEEQVTAKVLEKLKAETPVAVAPAVPPTPRELPVLKVEGFSNIAGVRYAMINGQTVREGANIEGAKVIAIERPIVRVTFDGREYTLRL